MDNFDVIKRLNVMIRSWGNGFRTGFLRKVILLKMSIF